MFCRSSGGAGAVALTSNFSGCSPVRALPVTLQLAVGRHGGVGVDAVDLVFDAVAQVGEHDRAAGDDDVLDRKRRRAALAELAVAWRRARARAAAACSEPGATMTSSLISGWPDQTLDSVTSASTLAAVRRLVMSRSFGSGSVTSFSVTFRDGQRPILVEPAMVELVAGLALDPRPGSSRSGSRRGRRRSAAARSRRSRRQWRRLRFSKLSCRRSRRAASISPAVSARPYRAYPGTGDGSKGQK